VSGVTHALSTFPNFLVYFVSACVLTAIFLAVYTRLTPHDELGLIRDGNVAAAVALVGSLLGFVIPLASVITHSVNLAELAIWGGVALAVQLGGFMAVRLLLPHVSQAVEQGGLSGGVFLAGLSIALGILNAACMAG